MYTPVTLAAVVAGLIGAAAVAPDFAADQLARAEKSRTVVDGHTATTLGNAYYSRYGYFAESCADLVETGYLAEESATPQTCHVIEFRLRDIIAQAEKQGVR